MTLRAGVAATIFAGGLMALPATPAVAAPTAVEVCPTCAVSTVKAALERVAPGGTVTVQAGTYHEHLVVTRPVHLVGQGRPVLDGDGTGTVVRLSAPKSSITGFEVRGSGDNLDLEDTGISVRAADVTVQDNVLDDDLFGIYAKTANRVVVHQNRITGRGGPQSLKGDGIRVYNSDDAVVTDNVAREVRDDLLAFDNGCRVSGNVVDESRYGLHLMWSRNCTVTNNTSTHNSVGIYVMYGSGLRLTGNTLNENRQSTGMGFGIRDSDDVVAEHNEMLHNRIGLDIYDSPTSLTGVDSYHANVLAYNDVGIAMSTGGHGNVITGNDLIDNVVQAQTDSQDSTSQATWSEKGRGNYWSDYTGYDVSGDHVGDVPYAPRQSFEALVNADPDFALFYLSPAAQALDWAAGAFPVLASATPITDPHPLTSPVAAAQVHTHRAIAWPLLLGSLALLSVGCLGIATAGRGALPATGRRRTIRKEAV